MFNKHVNKHLNAFLDGQLNKKMQEKVSAHLKQCATCSKELEELKTVSESLKSWQAPLLESGFESSITKEIVRREFERGRVKMDKKPVFKLIPAQAIAVILVGIVAIGLMQTYVKREIKGSLKSASNDIGEQLNGRFATSRIGGVRITDPNVYLDATGIDRKANTKVAISAPEKSDGYTRGLSEEVFSEPKEAQNSPVIVVTPILPTLAEGEMVIRTSTVRLEVENGKQTYAKVNEICQKLGGYTAESNFYKDSQGRESGRMVLRIPKEKFEQAMELLSSLGKLEGINTQSQDVSQEYANLSSRLDTNMIVYKKMLEALEKRNVTIPDAVRLESELTPVRDKIENLKHQIEQLKSKVSLATITLDFHEATVSAKVLKESRGIINEKLLSAGINSIRFVAQAIPVAVMIALWAIVGLAVINLLKLLLSKLNKRG